MSHDIGCSYFTPDRTAPLTVGMGSFYHSYSNEVTIEAFPFLIGHC